MVEPPSQKRRGRILEINDHILVAVKYSALERMRSFVRHSPVQKFSFRVDTLAVKARENSSRRRPVEAFIVEADSNLQFPLPPLAFRQTSPARKVNKDGRSLCACQEARMKESYEKHAFAGALALELT
jgi:hypothetical protein